MTAIFREFLIIDQIIAHVGEFTKGAIAISVLQSTVTAQVKALELAFDLELSHWVEKSTPLTFRDETLYGINRLTDPQHRFRLDRLVTARN
jgi:hypothetical protein